LQMQRDLWFGCLAALAVLTRSHAERQKPPFELTSWTRYAGTLGAFAPRDRLDAPGIPFRYLVVAVLAAFVLVRIGWQFVELPGTEAETTHKGYPLGAVQYMREHLPDGPILNDFNWGGYLIWSLPKDESGKPRYPVSIDGRTNLHVDRLGKEEHLWSAGYGATFRDEFRNANVIIAPLNRNLTDMLRRQSGAWKLAHEDDLVAVFVRQKK
jgi:hypothetical protein